MVEVQFLDTYALIENIRDGKYEKKLGEIVGVTLKTNLLEFYYYMIRNYDCIAAKHFFKVYSQILEETSLDVVKSAAEFRFENKKKGFSYADALGYQYALANNITFVTGDRAFKGMRKVKIVR